MSNKVIFTAPDGQEYADPDFQWLTDLVTHADDGYWASGSGDAGLRFERDGKPHAEMVLIIRAAYGAMVHHLYAADGLEYVMSEPHLGQTEVTVKYGGNPWSLPRAFFINRRKAADAVQHFLQDGQRKEGGNWVEF